MSDPLDQHMGSFNRAGEPVTVRELLTLVHEAELRGEDYRRLALDVVGSQTVSTVLLLAAPDGRPFETAVWGDDIKSLAIVGRYVTPEAALAGHERAVQAVREGRLPGPPTD